MTYLCLCKKKKFPPCVPHTSTRPWFTTHDITAAIGAFVMLSGMMSTGESMQIYGNDNRSFESCQLDLETQAMKKKNPPMKIYFLGKLVYTETCTHAGRETRTHADYTHNPPESALDKWHFHMLKVTSEIAVVSINLGPLVENRRRGGRVISIKHYSHQVEEPRD